MAVLRGNVQVHEILGRLGERQLDYLRGKEYLVGAVPNGNGSGALPSQVWMKQEDVLSLPEEKVMQWLDNLSVERLYNIKEKLHLNLVDDQWFEWIAGDNARTAIFVQNKLRGDSRFGNCFIYNMPAKERRRLIIRSVDFAYFGSRQQKEELLRQIHQDWSLAQRDRRVEKWLGNKAADEGKWVWAEEYLQKHYKLTGSLCSTNAKEAREYVLVAFDCWLGSGEGKELFFAKLKKAWGQKKYRDKIQGRRQYNFVLSLEAKAQLNALAKHYGLAIYEVLEILIKNECLALTGQEATRFSGEVLRLRGEMEEEIAARSVAGWEPISRKSLL